MPPRLWSFLVLTVGLLLSCERRVVTPAADPVTEATPAKGALPASQPDVLRTWDFSAWNGAAALGVADSKGEGNQPGAETWYWKRDGRMIIKLPRGRTIDTWASSIHADVINGRVTSVGFDSFGSSIDAAELRKVMERSFDELHVQRDGSREETMRILDRFIAQSQTSAYTPSENFGSRDDEPSVDIYVSTRSSSGCSLVYTIFWAQ